MKIVNLLKYSTALLALSSSLYANTDVLEEIKVVSASGYEQDILNAPATISVVTKEQLENKGYIDIAQALKDVPGTFVDGGGNSKGKGMGGETISVRGMDGDYTLYLVDGKPLTNSGQVIYNGEGNGAETGWLPPIAAVERIEVIKGPMSSLYGSQAMGGVVNIITKKVSDNWSGALSIDQTFQENSEYGNAQQYKTYLSGPLIKDKLNLSLMGQFTHKDEDKVYYGSKEHDRITLSSKLNWILNDSNDLSFQYGYYDQDSIGDGGTYRLNDGSSTTQDPSDNDMSNRIYDLTHTLKWADSFETKSYIKLEDSEATHSSYESEYESMIINSKTVMPFETNILTVGAEYIKEEAMHDASRAQTSTSTLEKWNASLFAEDEFYVTDNFSLTTGLRVNKDEHYGSELTPRVYGVYLLSDELSLKGGVSTGYKTPDLDQADSNFLEGYGGGAGYISGDENLEPEKSLNYEIGLAYQGDNGLNLSATVYKTQFKDMISTEIICDETAGDADCVPDGLGLDESRTAFYKYINIDEAELYGIELTGSYQLNSVALNANYTFNQAEITNGDSEGDPLNNTPKHMFNLGADWQVNKALGVWSKLKYVGTAEEVGRSGTTYYPHYTLVDLGMNYKINNDLKIHANINNLFDKEIGYEEFNKVLDGRRLTIGLNYTF